MPKHTLKIEMDLPEGVDGEELVSRVSLRIVELLRDEAQLMRGGFAEFLRRDSEAHLDLMVDRGYASCADPRLRPFQREIMTIVSAPPGRRAKPGDLARRLAKALPQVSFNWGVWVSDEMTIARVRHQMTSLRRQGFMAYDWIGSPDDCGRCRMFAAQGPYRIGAGPLPVLDSHSECTCVLAGHVPSQ